MVEAEPEQACGLLRSGEIDLALVYDHDSMPPSFAPDCELTPLVEDTYDVILAAEPPARRSGASSRSPTWPTSRGSRPRSPTAAAASPTRCAAQAGFEPRVAFEADDTMASQALVAAGVGVTLMPRLALTSCTPAWWRAPSPTARAAGLRGAPRRAPTARRPARRCSRSCATWPRSSARPRLELAAS